MGDADRRPPNDGWADRLWEAKALYDARHEEARRREGKRRKISHAEIAAAIGLTGMAVNRYFEGAEPSTFEIVEKIARVLEVNPGWLVFGPEFCSRDVRAQFEPVADVRLVEARQRAKRRKRKG